MPLTAMAAAHGGLDAFRLATPAEVATTLRQLQEGAVLVNLNAPQGGAFTTTLWAVDTARRALSFAAEADDPQLQALLEGDEATVVAYLENIKVQFDVHNLVLVRGTRASALQHELPARAVPLPAARQLPGAPRPARHPGRPPAPPDDPRHAARAAHPGHQRRRLRAAAAGRRAAAHARRADQPRADRTRPRDPLRDGAAPAPRDLDPDRCARRAPGLRDVAPRARTPNACCSATSTRRRSADGSALA